MGGRGYQRLGAVVLGFFLVMSGFYAWAREGGVSSGPQEEDLFPLQLTLHDSSALGVVKDDRLESTEGVALVTERALSILKMFKEPLGTNSPVPGFFVRTSSKPAPTSVLPVKLPFPAPTPGPQEATEKLDELRLVAVVPEGAVDRVPRLSITFNQPMIAIGDPKDFETDDPLGIQLKPRPDGSWRWLGTQSLIFEPKSGEFPRATDYTVEIPEGVQAVSGARLARASKTSFTLPAPKVSRSVPDGKGIGLQPLLVVAFDQPVHPESVQALTSLTVGSKRLALKLLSNAEAKALDERVFGSWAKSEDGTVVFFTTADKLQPALTYQFVVAPGVESREGSLLSEAAYQRSFSTFEPLKITETYPQEKDKASPQSPLVLTFNNAIDRRTFSKDFVHIEPEIPGAKIGLRGSKIVIDGLKSGRTTYRVTVSGKLRDVFAQELGVAETRTFVTDRMEPALFSTFDQMTVLQATDQKTGLVLYSTNVDRLRLVVHKVEPTDWVTYLTRPRSFKGKAAREGSELPGQEVAQVMLTPEGKPDELTETFVDLSQYLDKGRGNLIVFITDPSEDEADYSWRSVITWVQATNLGLDLTTAHDEATVMLTRLSDGSPVEGATVRLGSVEAKTEAGGVATLALTKKGAEVLVAQSADDRVFLPYTLSSYGDKQGWVRESLQPAGRWFIFDDRGLYRPGETVHVKGYVRQWARGPQGALDFAGKTGEDIHFTLSDPRGNKVAEGKTTLSALGTVDFQFVLPKDVNLGSHQLSISGSGLPSGGHRVEVQEFRRPEFEVAVEPVVPGPYYFDTSAQLKAVASYYAGGGLAAVPVRWDVTSTPSNFSPPGHAGFLFGQWSPWWDLGPWWRPHQRTVKGQARFEGVADAQGEHLLGIDFGKASAPTPTRVTATATATDVNRQAMAGSVNLLVHPSAFYVGLKAPKTFVEAGQSFEYEAIVSDVDGKIQTDIPIDVRLLKLTYEEDDEGEYKEREVPVSQTTVMSGATPVKARLVASEGGTYLVRASVTDAQGRVNETTLRLWKAGGVLPASDRVKLETLIMVPSAKEYHPGQTARLLIVAPFAEGTGLVSWSRDGFVHKESFKLHQGSATVSYPITEELLPNLHADVTVAGSAPWGKGQRPAVAHGEISLNVSLASRELKVEVLPAHAKFDPGSEVELEAVVTDSVGTPVSGAEVSLWMVDEAVLDLVGYELPNPLKAFYTQRPSGLTSQHLRTQVALGRPNLDAGERDRVDSLSDSVRFEGRALYKSALPAPAAAMREGGGGEPSSDGPAFIERKDFRALAVFKGELTTDAQGQTKVKVKLPDDLTRYRILSVAIKGAKDFGSGDQLLTTRLPLMVRPSLPRFLYLGDRVKLPVVLQNQSDQPLEVEVVGEASGVTWVGPQGKKLTLPANDRREVVFECRATEVGTARFRFGAVAGSGRTDAARIELPVYTPASTENFVTYGTLDEKKSALGQDVLPPKDVWPQTGGLQVSFSSTALSELTDAFLYLYAYPFDCAEQKASRILSIAALRDVLTRFHAKGLPDKDKIKEHLAQDVTSLSRIQNTDGGWSFWTRDGRSIPFVSLHVTHALVRVKQAGFHVDPQMMANAMSYTTNVKARCQEARYDVESTRVCQAYSLYIQALAKKPDLAAAKALFKELTVKGSELNLEALGWIWPTLAADKSSRELKELERLVFNQVTQTADKAQFHESIEASDKGYLLLHSRRRVDAIMLYALLKADPANPLNPKLVRGLLSHRVKGRWANTQESSWVLLALQQYFHTFEAKDPRFIARAWFGGEYLGEESFAGRQAKEARIEVPMAALSKETKKLIISKEGSGRLYYRVGMSYAPQSTNLPAENRGFAVERRFLGVDNPEDVARDDEGSWVVKAGAMVRVELSMVVPERRYHVALVDPLAAGLEPLNPDLLGTPPQGALSSSGPRSPQFWGWPWPEHENLRDDRVEAFASLLYPGVYTYSYTARATTPGDFALPPTKVEEMYSPDVYGRTASGRLIVR